MPRNSAAETDYDTPRQRRYSQEESSPPAKRTSPKKKKRRSGLRIFLRGPVTFIRFARRPSSFHIVMMTISLLLAFGGVLSTILVSAHIAQTELQITSARSDRVAYQARNISKRQQIDERYTTYEIERLASERLGMSRPDPAQIIEIYVPRHSYVVLNTAEYALPRQNYFWQDLQSFVSGIFGRLFR